MAFEFTPAQRRAILDRDGAVLVSAAAGSGKTRVLTERLAAYVSDPDKPTDIDRFLVITYTRAAAAELRDRITQTLNQRLSQNPEDRRLRRQQLLVCRAHIGTIHSFCAALLRENCHALGLPPRFTVLEEERAETLRRNVLTKLLDGRYDSLEADPAFRQLVDTVGAGTDDKRLEQAVLQLHDKLRSQPRPEAWAEAQRRAFYAEGVADAGETVWGRELLADARRRAEHWLHSLEAAIDEMEAADPAIQKSYATRFAEAAQQLQALLDAVPQGWDKTVSACRFRFPRLGGLRNYENVPLQERMKAVWNGCKSACGDLERLFDEGSEPLLQELRSLAPAMERLLELTLELDAAFSAEKLRRGGLDYADLEHGALRLLLDGETGERTALARETAERFVEILVDEYQDVSPVQESIIRALSREEGNLFLVGDVKQSIYRFRLADPGLFLRRYDAYAPAESAQPGQPRRIDLQQNFRSRRAVLTAANRAFSALMSRELGELDYDEAAALHYGAPDYPEGTDVQPELCLIESGGGGEEESPDAAQREARYVARRILRMMGERTQVYGPEGSRDCRWGDFVLLLRSPNGRGGVYHRVLAEHGIPVSSRQGDGFFTALEVTVAVNLLSLVDNPHADVPLISVLRSPVFAFTGDELALIRAGRREGDFYGAVCAAAERGDAHCAEVLEKLRLWRALAPDLTLDRLLWRICADTELFAVCAAMPDADGRRQNLMRLFEYAGSYTRQGYRGVFRFVRWLRALAERGAEPETPADENAVRILSIHRSKGLEFPFVFLCDLSRRFNRRDLSERVLMHTVLGLGPKAADSALGLEYPTLARRAISRRLEREMLSEELRVLYVAMTRARERLILTAALRRPEESLSKLAQGLSAPIPPETLRAASDPGRWLTLAALLPGSGISLRLAGEDDGAAPEAETGPQTAAEASEDAADEVLAARLDWRYAWAGAVELPARLTATGLEGQEEGSEAAPLLPPEPEHAAPRFRSLALERARRLSAAEQGTATHSFLQYLDFARTDTPEALKSELRRVEAAGHLSREEAEAVDLRAVGALFASPLGRTLRGATDLRREFRFTLLAEARDYYPAAAPEDRLLLQGVVDCFYVEDGAVTVVDYKTDRVSPDQAPARAERYRPQMRAYALALERILGLPVRRCVLWFLRPAVGVEVE